MKKNKQSLFLLFLATMLVMSFTACGSSSETAAQSGSETAIQTADGVEVEPTGPWETAVYLTDTEIGQGEKTLTVIVSAEGQAVRFTVHTDEDTVGAALLAEGLIAGEDGAYGLYIKSVNGMTADYDADQSYWSFYINGEMATSGVDGAEIIEGTEYQLEYTK